MDRVNAKHVQMENNKSTLVKQGVTAVKQETIQFRKKIEVINVTHAKLDSYVLRNKTMIKQKENNANLVHIKTKQDKYHANHALQDTNALFVIILLLIISTGRYAKTIHST